MKNVLTAGHIHRIERLNYAGNTGAIGGLIFKGETVSVQVWGSQTRPVNGLTDMVLINELAIEDATIAAAGAYPFLILPDFIAVVGTVTAVEIVGYGAAEDLGEIPS